MYRIDKSNVPVSQILAGGEIDFINSVCPCAGLSMLNTSKGKKGRSADAAQNMWMYKSSEFVLANIKSMGPSDCPGR